MWQKEVAKWSFFRCKSNWQINAMTYQVCKFVPVVFMPHFHNTWQLQVNWFFWAFWISFLQEEFDFALELVKKCGETINAAFHSEKRVKQIKFNFSVFHQVWFSCTIIHSLHSILGDGKKCGQRFGDWDRPRGSNILPILPIFDILDILDILDQPISDQQVEKALIGGLREKFPNTRWPHIKNHIIIQ